jgi:transcriptional antiterminator
MKDIILNHDTIVIKSFNNNIVLVKEKEKEKILFKRGIGFGKKPGEVIKKGIEIEKIFVIEDEDNQRNFNEIVNIVDNRLIVIVEEVIAEIEDELGEKLGENIHVGLVDHLYYAIKRLQNEEEIQNPFLIEIETLYSREFQLSQKILDRLKEELGIQIPEGEKGFITLHIHSARKNGKLSTTIKSSYLSNSIVEHVEKRLQVKINKKSLDYARFLTHIRFTIERVITNTPIRNDLIDVIKRRYKVSYKIAEETGKVICKVLEIGKISEDEIAYLAMHIERFRISLNQ